MSATTLAPSASRWQRFVAASVRAFHAYAGWLVGITWWRFILLALLLLILTGILQHVPPFSWKTTQVLTIDEPSKPPKSPKPAKAPKPPREPSTPIEKNEPGAKVDHAYEITIDEHGVRIRPKAPPAASAPQGAGSAAGSAAPPADAPSVDIRLPPGATSETVRQAVEEARREIVAAIEEARQAAKEEAEAAREEAQVAREEGQIVVEEGHKRVRVQTTRFGDFLPELALLWIIASVVIKITYKRQIQAEAQAAQATETAEAESLKRQVVEARMAAMQAQVEPHFLFNTLASIDHLIETEPSRASTMQKNLIALLRAAMPTMREAGDGGPRDLKRELEVIRPYLEILKVRMEDRLRTEIDVPEGLLSAEFPSMMIQTLVENAIKHGLEPKPEGGSLTVRAEVQHGKLAVTVADTGVGFGKAATSGTGVGLANVRERLQLLYGNKATLSVREHNGGGTAVTITVPYKSIEGASA
ncbi:MAG: sensor histidine kinase [Burkholderiales bacterium]